MEEFEKDLNEIKNKLNEYHLSDEFKIKLQAKMDEEYNKSYDNKLTIKTKLRKFPSSFVAAFACFFFLVSGCVTFADEFEDWVTKIFSNTNKKIEMAIENGNYKEINMDYVENNGVAIKVDYVITEEDMLCIAFNVKTKEEFADIFFENIEIKDGDYVLYNSFANQNVFKFKYSGIKENIKEKNIIYEFYKSNYLKQIQNIEINNLNINITNLCNRNKPNEINKIIGNWYLEL